MEQQLAESFLLNDYISSYQYGPSVAMDADGDFVISWTSYQDNSYTGIYANREKAFITKNW